jgi:hypothetical protein
MDMRRNSRRVGRSGEREAGELRIDDAGMVEVRGVGWPSTGGLRRVDMT